MEYTGPIAANELCITFQYGIVNNAGFTASDIFNMVNNTLKTGLIIAAADVTIEILNTSFPENNRLRHDRWNPFFAIHQRSSFQRSWRQQRLIVPLGYFQSHFPDGFIEQLQEGGDRRLVHLPTQPDQTTALEQLVRRLVQYLDSVPPEIIQIIDNPFCPGQSSNTQCAIVTSNVCVFLDDGDDRAEVRTVLRTGIQQAINSGEFEAAIPEANRLP